MLEDTIPGATNGNDTLVGTAGDDFIDGLKGADSMLGGAGNDTYVVDNAGDTVVELFGEGTDTVQSSINYTLGAEVENLILTGKAKNGTGNALDNVLTGNASANVLDGGVGADAMAGGAGNDSYVVDNAGDVVTEVAGGGTDSIKSSISLTLAAEVENLTLTGNAGLSGTGNGLNNSLLGNKGANTLDGGGGNDNLDGGLGADTMIGGTGNDSYSVDNAGDVVTELAGGGTKDSVTSLINYTLGAELENLTLGGVANLSGTGNGANNSLTGNAGDNALDGGAGNDTMIGGAGNDSYSVDSIADVITELALGGTDSVSSSVSYTLSAEVENLTLIGTDHLNATGNAGANSLIGNSGDNLLDGAAGADAMAGGAGNDTYVVDDAGDTLTELAGGGTDTVLASISTTLGSELERLTLTGIADLSGAGNALANLLTGNAGNNSLSGAAGNDTLDGGLGADTMAGGANADTYIVDDAGDVVNESSGAGNDVVQASVSHALSANVEALTLTGAADIDGTGNAGANTLNGNGGRNTLDGGAGADTMSGGGGADTYIVDDALDVVTEAANKGTDTVRTALSYTLGANLENLTLTGAADVNGTGNALNNEIQGNAGNNLLLGDLGNDTLVSGGGVDTLSGGDGDDVLRLKNGVADGGVGVDTLILTEMAGSAYSGIDYSYWYSENGYNLYASTDRSTIASALVGSPALRLYGFDASGFVYEQLRFSNVENLSVLAGSDDNDLLLSLGSGSLDGGAGADAMYADWSSATSALSFGATGGNGVTVTNVERVLLSTGSGGDNLDLSGFSGYNDVGTGGGADTIKLGSGAVDAGSGNDTLILTEMAGSAYSGIDYSYWYSENGYNLYASTDRSTIASALVGSPALRLYGFDASGFVYEQLRYSNVENLSVLAGSDDDDLLLSVGSGSLDGGAGDDAMYADWRSATTALSFGATGGNGVTLTNIERVLLSTGTGADNLDISSFTGYNDVGSGGGADTVTLTSGAVDGGSGNDTLNLTAMAGSAYSGIDYSYWYSENGYNLYASTDRSTIASALVGSPALRLYGFDTSGSVYEQFRFSNVENVNVLAGSDDKDLLIAIGTGTSYDGGANSDTFYADWSSSTSNLTVGAAGGNGVSVTNVERALWTLGSGNDTVNTAGLESVDLDAGAGTDTLNIAAIYGSTSSSYDYSYWYATSGYNLYAYTDRATIATALAGSPGLTLYGYTASGGGFEQVRFSNVENVNVLAGSDDKDLLIAIGTGTSYDGGANSDTFYADWSSSTSNLTVGAAGGNGVSVTNVERALWTLGSGNDTVNTAGLESVDLDAGAGTDTLNIAAIYGSTHAGYDYSYWYATSGYNLYAYTDRATIATALAGSPGLTLYGYTASGSGFEQVRFSNVENVNVLAGSDDKDLLIAIGTGTSYDGGANADTFYADWSASVSNLTVGVSGGNGVTVTNVERALWTLGSGNDTANTAGLESVDLDAGAGTDTLNIAAIYGSTYAGTDSSFWYSTNGYNLYSSTDRATIATALVGSPGLSLYGYTASGSGFEQVRFSNVENVNVLAGSDDKDLLMAIGAGTRYDGGANTDTFYADWSASTANISWVNAPASTQTVNGVQVSGLERLILSTGTGNDLIDNSAAAVGSTNDDINTGAGSDTINGGAGADLMTGGSGSDTYFVDDISDVVVELAGAGTGTDTVRSSLSWTLGDNVEKLVLLGSAALTGNGNTLANTLTGNSGANNLNGGDGNDTLGGAAGADTLNGGIGADTFQIDSLSAADLFTDFTSGLDKLLVSQAAVPVGDGDNLVEGAATIAGPGGFATSAELVVVTGDIAGSITAASAAAAIGSANSAYAVGQKVVFAVDNGSESQLWLFTAADANASVAAAELTLLTRLAGTASTATTDYGFGP